MQSPDCYVTDNREWVASARTSGGRSLIVTIPAAIVENMRLRPGSRVRLHIERFKEQVERDERWMG